MQKKLILLLPIYCHIGNGIPIEDAVDHVFDRYQDLQEAFPNKPIIITEVGWPSSGQPQRQAEASLANQAKFIRDFLNRAKRRRANILCN